jgi:hypothetical protein
MIRVNEHDLFGPERLLSASAWRSASRFLPDLSPYDRLCHRTAGFRSVFTTQRSRVGALGPVPEAFASWLSAPHDACRDLQSSRSASTTTRPYEPRSPCVRSPACTALLEVDLAIDVEPTGSHTSFEARPAEVSQARGWRRSFYQRLLPRSLVTGALPQPDPLGHLLSQDRRDGSLETHTARSVSEEHASRSRQQNRLASAPPLGPLLAAPREGNCDMPHPRCLPSTVAIP